MKIEYSDGSFMLAWQRMRAWYAPDGTVKDAEQIYMYRGYPAARALPARCTKIRAWLEKQGAQEIRFMQRMGKA